jgi:dihydroneopterin aldolase
MTKSYNSIVTLNDLLLKANIGVTEVERSCKQDLRLSFKLYFKDKPKACDTDKIEDTICYHEIANIALQYCSENDVKLLEYLCYGLYKKIKSKIGKKVNIWIKIEKCSPPIEGILGGTSFEYSDLDR